MSNDFKMIDFEAKTIVGDVWQWSQRWKRKFVCIWWFPLFSLWFLLVFLHSLSHFCSNVEYSSCAFAKRDFWLEFKCECAFFEFDFFRFNFVMFLWILFFQALVYFNTFLVCLLKSDMCFLLWISFLYLVYTFLCLHWRKKIDLETFLMPTITQRRGRTKKFTSFGL